MYSHRSEKLDEDTVEFQQYFIADCLKYHEEHKKGMNFHQNHQGFQ